MTNADSGIHYGDTKHGAENAWSAVGSMDNDDFRVADGEMVTRADMTFGGAKIGISLGDDTNISGTEKDYISLGITGSAGSFSYALAHQNANTTTVDLDDNSAFTQQATTGVRVSTTLGGATVALGYAKTTMAVQPALKSATQWAHSPQQHLTFKKAQLAQKTTGM
ncbi:hypothetical protein N9X37_04965 [Planktomarina temperata]|nr:hypothetical protein [Planktomarina temperata]